MRNLFLGFAAVAFVAGLIHGGMREAWTAAPTNVTTSKLTPQRGGVLRIIYPRDAERFGYPPLISGVSIILSRPALEPLLDVDSEGNFQPTYLATGFEVAPDGLSATIALRKGVKFHDGTDFNAEAMKWNLQKQAEQINAPVTREIKSVDVLDNYTIRINLKRYTCTFLEAMSLTASMPVSPTAYAKNGENWMLTHPVGTGPFKLKSFVRDSSVRYERFEGYWGPKPYLDGIEYFLIKDPMVADTALRSGQADLIYPGTVEHANELKRAGFDVLARMDTIISLSPDAKNANSPMFNKKVREALEYAIDREAIAKLGLGYWRAAYQWALPEFPLGYNPDLPRREYNPVKAKQLLAEAGYSNGFKTRIIFDIGHNFMDPMTAVQSYWKAVGVEADLQQLPRAQYIAIRSRTGWVNGYIEMPNNLLPANYLDLLAQIWRPYNDTSPIGRPGGNDSWNAAINRAHTARTYQEQRKTLQYFSRAMYEDATTIPLFSRADPVPIAKTVHDTDIGQMTSFFMWSPWKAWLSK